MVLNEEEVGKHTKAGIVAGRAISAEQKRAVIERILAVWEKNPQLRLGQLLVNTMNGIDDEHTTRRIFYVEDEELAQRLELLKAWQP